MKRREFLMGSAAALASGRAWGKRPDPAKLDRIAIMSLCFDAVLKSASRPADSKRTVDIMSFADMIARRYGIHRVEFQQTDFDSTEPAYFQEFRRRIQKAKSRVNQINLEFANLNISATDPVIRLEAIELTRSWIDHAVELDCPRVMVSQGTLAPAVRPTAIETLKTINAYAKTKNISVTMEPRWRADAANVPWDEYVEVLKASGTYSNPDCGNFPDNPARAAALPILYRMTAGSSHIKHIPDKFSTAEAIEISKEAGYKGIFTIEERGTNGPDPYAAVQTIVDVLLANL
ncbi:MAG: TIM barrel protein [Bryobacteraceae bacterium]|jgi:sugar phosphate isomerase/epimerase